MPSWEELFVDREIDDAWRHFRQEATAALEDGGALTWEFYADDDLVLQMLSATVTRDEDALVVKLFSQRQAPELRRFGFRSDRRRNLLLRLTPQEIDRAVAGLILGLREGSAQVVHPSFIEWSTDGSEPRRICPPGRTPASEQRRGAKYEIVAPLDADDLTGYVHSALAERVNGPFDRDEDGGFTLTNDAAVCFVNVRAECAIEVWTVLALNIEHPASIDGFHRMLPKLLEESPCHRFYLQDGNVFASRIVDGHPFVPSHLYAAVEATFELSREHQPMGDFLTDLAHPEEGCQPTLPGLDGGAAA